METEAQNRRSQARAARGSRHSVGKEAGNSPVSVGKLSETSPAESSLVSTEKARQNRIRKKVMGQGSVGKGKGVMAAENVRRANHRRLRRKDRHRGMICELKEKERLDDLQRNGYRIIQNPEKFCFGMDAVLLTGFAQAREGDRLLDLGTGTGIIPLLMEAKYRCGYLAGLEIQAESADMAARSVKLNGLEEKIEIIVGDMKEADSFFPSASFDCVTCNPPYMPGRHGLVNPSGPKAIARHEILCTFENVAEQAAKLLKPGGHFFLVHRPFRLAEIMLTLERYKLEPKRMQLVYPYVDREPNMVLLEAVRGGRTGMKVEKPLIVFREPGVYMPEIREVYGY